MVTRLEESALQAAQERGREFGLSASRLIERSLVGTEQILDRMEAELRKPDLDAQDLRSLIAGWRDAVQVGRQTHRLDDQPAVPPLVRIALLGQSRLCTAAEIAAEASAQPESKAIIDITPKDGTR